MTTVFRLLTVGSLAASLSACTMMSGHDLPGASGLIELRSPYSVTDTLDRVSAAGAALGFKTAARINHAQAAQDAGLTLRPTEVLLLGNPAGGTPLMQCAQTVAIDLPMKFLAYQNAAGQVVLAYNDPVYLQRRHRASGCGEAFGKASTALARIAADALK
ncbi:DUF302 domain-containing protein [Deinococcus aerophilus]|uniref:DUF302 domain-containing protein n=1 Tax=Deinococcus aerophilus TaxID=522488 RepID=A0ABQ2GTK2_9DEIO|nr:DUF302 domain-containing protein [Deinococcus aerophilus]GGM10990.1 hypothetical protein GCM10010841_19330 [Deinococcus aerophilus]